VVENIGKVAGEEVVQLYIKTAGPGGPLRSLAGFRRVALNRGDRKTVEFVLSPRELSSVAEDGQHAVNPGSLQIAVGGSQPGANVHNILTGAIRIEGSAKPID